MRHDPADWGEEQDRVEGELVSRFKAGESMKSIAQGYGIRVEKAREIIFRRLRESKRKG